MPAQDQWAEHAAFMNGLVDAGLILLGGPTVRTFDERWERTTPWLTDGLGDPRQRGLSPVPTCSHFERESRYKAATRFEERRYERPRARWHLVPLGRGERPRRVAAGRRHLILAVEPRRQPALDPDTAPPSSRHEEAFTCRAFRGWRFVLLRPDGP